MNSINSLDLKTLITNVVGNVFDTMLSMKVESIEDTLPDLKNRERDPARAGLRQRVARFRAVLLPSAYRPVKAQGDPRRAMTYVSVP